MKITIIRHSIRNWGADRLIFDYLDYLIPKGFEVEYWTNRVTTVRPINPKIKIKKIPIPGIIGTILFTMFSRFKGDIVMVDLIVMVWFASFKNRNKTLYLAQDYDVHYYKSQAIVNFVEFCYRRTLNRLSIKAISVSQGLTERLLKYHPKNLMTISNGVNLKLFYRDPNSPYLTKRSKPFTILFFAREDHRKGLDVAIRALEHLAKINQQANWEVWTIGLESIPIQNVPIKNFGFLKTDEEMKGILSAADIFLIPSRSEGLSLLLLQTLACQCAVVSTAASSILTHELNGLVSPIEDWETLAKNLKRVIEDDGLRKKLQTNARALAQEYSLEKSCQKFEQALISFAKESSP